MTFCLQNHGLNGIGFDLPQCVSPGQSGMAKGPVGGGLDLFPFDPWQPFKGVSFLWGFPHPADQQRLHGIGSNGGPAPPCPGGNNKNLFGDKDFPGDNRRIPFGGLKKS